MAVTLIVHGDGTATVAFGRTAFVEKIEATGNAAAHRLYNAGRYVPVDADEVAVPWEELTNQQKLNMLDKFVLGDLHEMAMGYLHNERQAAARACREEDAETIL